MQALDLFVLRLKYTLLNTTTKYLVDQIFLSVSPIICIVSLSLSVDTCGCHNVGGCGHGLAMGWLRGGTGWERTS